MARRKQAPKDLTGIRPRGGRYQIRLFGGQDPVTGKQVMLTGSAEDEDAAIKLRDKFRRHVSEATAARTSVTLGYLLDEWLAGHQVEETTRTSYRVAIENFLKPAVGDTSLTRLASPLPVRSSSSMPSCGSVGGGARDGRSSSTTHIGCTSATSGARRISADRCQCRRSGSATRC